MPVVNYKVWRFSGEKNKPISGRVDVKATSGIKSMSLKHDERVGDYIEVNFRYDLNYSEGVGKLEIEGSLWYLNKELKKQVKETETHLELPSEAVQEISTAILQDSLLESIELCKKLGLPAPISLPVVKVKPKQVKFLKSEEKKKEEK